MRLRFTRTHDSVFETHSSFKKQPTLPSGPAVRMDSTRVSLPSQPTVIRGTTHLRTHETLTTRQVHDSYRPIANVDRVWTESLPAAIRLTGTPCPKRTEQFDCPAQMRADYQTCRGFFRAARTGFIHFDETGDPRTRLANTPCRSTDGGCVYAAIRMSKRIATRYPPPQGRHLTTVPRSAGYPCEVKPMETAVPGIMGAELMAPIPPTE